MCASWKEGKMLAQWVCAEKSMFALHAVAVSESVFIIRSDGMLSLCVHAADGRWDLLSPPEQLRLAHHAPCTSLDACGLPHVFITKGASRAASLCNGCLKMHLLICMRVCFIVYVGAAWCVASRSACVHTEELDVLKGRRLCASARLRHVCVRARVRACRFAPAVTRLMMALSSGEAFSVFVDKREVRRTHLQLSA